MAGTSMAPAPSMVGAFAAGASSPAGATRWMRSSATMTSDGGPAFGRTDFTNNFMAICLALLQHEMGQLPILCSLHSHRALRNFTRMFAGTF
jgi:hypothetical protein